MSKKLWGGRFKKEIDKEFFDFQKSIQCDYKLAEYDVVHSFIHVQALKESGILTNAECEKLTKALEDILKEIERGIFKPDFASEDIHSDIQNRVEKKVGKVALKMHALRSRNDQVAFDEKYFCKKETLVLSKLLLGVGKSLVGIAEKYKGKKFIGYTHTQRAQAIYLSDYLFSYAEMLVVRDFDRLMRFSENLIMGIGAGAMTGSALSKAAYDEAIKRYLKLHPETFQKRIQSTGNPLDAVSDRDFIIEFLSILSIIQMHLSRLAEDLILYSTKEFNYIDLPEEFCTGSSLMPHKKNPDFLELVRGNTGRIYGNLMSILTTMKGLPLTYNRDMQLDKEPLFSSVEIVKDELKIMARFLQGIKLNTGAINKALEDESLYATELAEFLVVEKKVPFKEAHTIIGKLIRYSEDKNVKIKEMPDTFLKTFHEALNQKHVKRIMNPHYAVTSKKSFTRRIPRIEGLKGR